MKKDIIKILEEIAQSIPQAPVSKLKADETAVTFDKSTNPFRVVFSERGFEINDTRFSFEFIETALSKDVNIVLNKGAGMVLDSVKMEKILKYKHLYAKSSIG